MIAGGVDGALHGGVVGEDVAVLPSPDSGSEDATAGDKVVEGRKITGAEDFSFFQRQVPGLFLLLGITPPADVGMAGQNHSPKFFVDESALITGVRTLAQLAVDYLNTRGGSAAGAK